MTQINHGQSGMVESIFARLTGLDSSEMAERVPEWQSDLAGRLPSWTGVTNKAIPIFGTNPTAELNNQFEMYNGDLQNVGQVSSDIRVLQATAFAGSSDSALSVSAVKPMAAAATSPEKFAGYLASGYWRETGQAPHSFDTSSSNVLTVSLAGLTAAEKTMARGALDAWAMVADITFRETGGNADIRFSHAGSKAVTNVYFTPDGETAYADVFIGAQWVKQNGSTVGSYSFQTYIHEIGHALGLGHPGNYGSKNGTEFVNDSWQISAMSYNSQASNKAVDASFAYVASAMMADVIAIQSLYGARKGGDTASGTVYGENSKLGNYLDDFFEAPKAGLAHNALTIFDEGGTDRIDFSDDTTRQVVNLTSGTYSDVYGLIGNLGIAKGTVIENFTAGSHADRINGNGAANTIKGNGGNDTIYGAGGNDVLIGGSGRDAMFGDADADTLKGEGDNDTLSGGGGHDSLVGDDGADTLRGSDGNDNLNGGDGGDLLEGGSGNDFLAGGAGTDAFVFAAGQDTIGGFENNYDELRLDNAIWNGRSLTVDQALDYARVVSGDLFFDFGNGNKLTIRNFTNAEALRDDLIIF